MSIETAKCPRGHVISFRRPWWRAVAPLRTAAIANCARCRSELTWRTELPWPELPRRQPDEEAAEAAPFSITSAAPAPAPDHFVSGGGGVFDGGGASGRWEDAPLRSNAWRTYDDSAPAAAAVANDIAPAPSPSSCEAPAPAPAYEAPAPSAPSPSDSGSCSASDSGSSSSSDS